MIIWLKDIEFHVIESFNLGSATFDCAELSRACLAVVLVRPRGQCARSLGISRAWRARWNDPALDFHLFGPSRSAVAREFAEDEPEARDSRECFFLAAVRAEIAFEWRYAAVF